MTKNVEILKFYLGTFGSWPIVSIVNIILNLFLFISCDHSKRTIILLEC